MAIESYQGHKEKLSVVPVKKLGEFDSAEGTAGTKATSQHEGIWGCGKHWLSTLSSKYKLFSLLSIQ